jgi:hypothetical protein
VQYTAIARIAVLLSGLITLSYMMRPEGKSQHGIAKLGNSTLGIMASISFILVGSRRLFNPPPIHINPFLARDREAGQPPSVSWPPSPSSGRGGRRVETPSLIPS